MAKSQKAAPEGLIRIAGSERRPRKNAKMIGDVTPEEHVLINLHLRRRTDAPPVPDMEHWANTPLKDRKYIKREEFGAVYGASKEDMDRVTAFASDHHLAVKETNTAARSVVVEGKAKDMESAFGVKLHYYDTGKEKYRGREGFIHLPAEISGIVEGIFGLDNRLMARRNDNPADAVPLTPPQVAGFYSFPAAPTVNTQTVGIIEFGGGYTPSDINSYCDSLGVSRPTILSPMPVNGASNAPDGTATSINSDTDVDFEVVLDMEVVAAAAPGVNIVVYFAPIGTDADWVAAIKAAIHDTTNKPSVISISWGWPELEANALIGFGGSPWPFEWTQQAVNAMTQTFQEAASLGVTVLVSSGDQGVDCQEDDGNVHVIYPGSDPWVISCGGTAILNVNGSSFDEETWNDFGATGGGISQIFSTRPSWQQGLSMPSPIGGGPAGRGLPDVAGNASPASGYDIFIYGKKSSELTFTSGFDAGSPCGPIGGTSAVSPLYAALTARLNANLNLSLGYLNPSLYALEGTSAFRDITVGNNSFNGVTGYNAGSGWDACTGLGVIEGTSLQTALTIMDRQDCFFIAERSTFGKDEVDTLLPMPGGAAVTDAFYVVVEGFTPDQLQLNGGNLTNPPVKPIFSGAFQALTDVQITFDQNTGVQLQDLTDFHTKQRITFPFTITFLSDMAFSNIPANPGYAQYTLSTTVNVPATGAFPAASVGSSMVFELVLQADPYMVAGDTSWLSNDMRVFQVTPDTLGFGQNPLLYSSTPWPGDPNSYIKNLIDELNTNFYTNPNASPFNSVSANEDTSALQLSQKDTNGNPVYNFALSRVRLQGDSASDVRCFFRMFIASSPDTEFNTATTYRRNAQTDSGGNPIAGTEVPLLGFPINDMPVTIPFFANPRIDPTTQSMTAQDDSPNIQTIPNMAINPAPGSVVYAYFGCWIDNNQPAKLFPLNPSSASTLNGPWNSSEISSIPEILMSNHACLVAEIAYDPDPIPASAAPGNTDKLGQRNLDWSPSDNPGAIDSHRIPATFDTRPTATGTTLPDELMIEWGNTPKGSVASIYWPQVNATEVIKLADILYGSSGLSQSDAHTIRCTTGSVTYIPIPPSGDTRNFSGMITIDLPSNVVKGQHFEVTVHRISTRTLGKQVARSKAAAKKTTAPGHNTPQFRAAASGQAAVNLKDQWRYITGTFQLDIPVSKKEYILSEEESLLAVFKWKLQQVPISNRWYPVLQRYVALLSGRVNAFGGDAGKIPASPGGYSAHPTKHPHPVGGNGNGGNGHHDHRHTHTGKVSGILFDRFGDFSGFHLDTDEGLLDYHSHEPEIEVLVDRAWRERILITVHTNGHGGETPESIEYRTIAKPLD